VSVGAAVRRAVALLLGLLSSLLLGVVAGCPSGPQCEIPSDCPEGQTCNSAGQCITQSCTSSNDCEVESYCNLEAAQCTAGCLNDRDCLPTHVCDQDAKRCITPGCRSTELDCNVGEFCNALTGECYDAGGMYCAECESREDCNGGNPDGPNWCLRMGGNSQTYCGVDCSQGQPCPRGYDCLRVITVGQVTVAYQCAAPCWEY